MGYETLAADYTAEVTRVLAGLGMDGVPIPPPPLRRQADAITDEWIARFLDEPAR